MFLLRRPNKEQIRRVLETQRNRPYSYEGIGAGAVPPGYNIDHHRIKLGEGSAVFSRSIEALKRWEMFNMYWLQLCWPDTPIEVGSMVAVVAHHLGIWSLNVCRIVSVIYETGDRRRYGFSYGTLPEHAERGQEQFVIEWHRSDDSVWYDIEAYSRPNQLLAKLGYPIARLLQKRFARDSLAAMLRSSK